MVDPQFSPCSCKKKLHASRRVVVTGGPGAGKTAVLEIVKRNFCRHVAVLPEAASIVFGGGFLRENTVPARKAAQRAIFHIQRELERMIEEEKKWAVTLCDRGTLDGVAYWPGVKRTFFSDLAITQRRELERYHAVIHLRTPSADQGYNNNNPVRIETPEQAAEIDGRIARVWEGHPRRFFIDSAHNFLEKAREAIEVIRQELPPCCEIHPIEELVRA